MASSSPAASAVSGSPPPHVVEDCLGIVQLLSDGTVTRSADYSALPLHGDVPPGLPVQWKDVVYDAAHGLRLRMYRPTTAAGGGGKGDAKKLPVLVYFHSGGFCTCSFELPNFHAAGLRLAAELPALVLSGDYRLAPEHRLPAAHSDAEAVLSWLLRAAADPWLAESADLGRVFAGGNISHHLAVRHGVRLAGCVLLWPFFAGEERTPSEAAGLKLAAGDSHSSMGTALFDQTWRLALPAGATRDHPAANPFGPGSAPLGEVALPPLLVVDPDLDVLHDRIADYAARLTAMGKPVELVVFEGQGHGFFVFEPWGEASDQLIRVIRQFVHGG